MNRKVDWLVALALSVTMVGVASAENNALFEIDGIKGEAEKKRPKSQKGAEKPKDIASKPDKPQALLLPAVQKASDIRPDSAPPAPRSKPRVAAGDVNGDGRADVVGRPGAEQQSNRARAVLTTRKAGEGQGSRGRASGQVRTNQ